MNRLKPILFVAEAVTLAHAMRSVVLAKTLDPQRYAVHIACAPSYQALIEKEGLKFYPIDTLPEAHYLAALARCCSPYDEARFNAYIREELALFKRLTPSLVVGDHRRSLAVSTALAGIPYAVLTHAHWSRYSTLPRFPVPEHPLVSILGLRIVNYLAPFMRPIVFKRFARPLDRLRRRYNLSPLPDLCQQLTEAGDYTLYADTPGFSPTAGLPSNHRYVGPVAWSAPATTLPDWWDSDPPSNRPWIYVSLGSSGRLEILPIILQALSKMPVTGIVATGGRVHLENLPENIHTAVYLPGALAAAHSQLVISNGGSGSVFQALSAGTPIFGIASNIDQHLVMSCVQRAGAGLLLRSEQASMPRIIEAISLLMSNIQYKNAAAIMAEEFKRFDPQHQFPAFVEEVVGK